jgi:hypothetical protein
MALLWGTCYDPPTAVTAATTGNLAMTALDTSNLRATFNGPASGWVLVRLQCTVHGATTFPAILLGVLQGSSVIRRVAPIGGIKATAVATTMVTQEATFVYAVTPTTAYTWDAAYGCETGIASTAIKYGGPNDTTTNNAFGGFCFEVWEA